jgi:two-component system LytT family response regulator
MAMIRSVIIDDEVNNREDLRMMLESRFSDRIMVVGSAASVGEGVKLINQTLPDVVFLDIRMPGEDGFNLLERYDDISFEVVFTTAFEEYAIRAIRAAAFDFLLKPVDEDDILNFLDRYEKKSRSKSVSQKVRLLLTQLQQGPDSSVLVSLPSGKEFKVVNARDIMYCQADVNYANIFLTGGSRIIVTKTLGKVEKILAFPFFFRCHKSYLVNLNHIDSYNRTDGWIRMKSGETIYLADRRIEDFINIFTSRVPE